MAENQKSKVSGFPTGHTSLAFLSRSLLLLNSRTKYRPRPDCRALLMFQGCLYPFLGCPICPNSLLGCPICQDSLLGCRKCRNIIKGSEISSFPLFPLCLVTVQLLPYPRNDMMKAVNLVMLRVCGFLFYLSVLKRL